MKKLIDIKWKSSPSSHMGIGLYETGIGQQVAYMSPVSGHHEQLDTRFVSEFGAKLTLSEAVGFFGDKVLPEKYKYIG